MPLRSELSHIYIYITFYLSVDFERNLKIFQTLYDEGGRKFWVHNTGPLGCLPQKLSMVHSKAFDKHGCLSSYNSAAKLFNEGLDHMCREMRTELRDADIVYVDIYAIKYDLIANSTNYGMFLFQAYTTPLSAVPENSVA